ncbi:cytochrome P450 [Leucogyrophana mollusca]|uniref:Cytochrome P450 n=1 Tax=Leucogyrophana mollusca TaxID=85980 RepID=A0ACB8AY32_9AGAM|nr:cytochrome P450 [Leucogyrophana mollusca]
MISHIVALLLAILLAGIYFSTSGRKHDVKLNIPTKRSFWYIGTPEFFVDPFGFIMECIEWSKGELFSFRVMNNTVIVLRGIPGRDAFFSKGLDFMAGYRMLNPQLVDVMPVSEIKGDESWAGFMANFIRSEVLERMYPTMLQDISKIIDTWGHSGATDPFKNVYELVFALSMRLATCNEFCDDPTKVKALMRIFDRLEAGSTPTSVILPWFPTPARIGRLLAGGELYKMISDVVQARKKEGRREDDPLQVLIDKGFTLVEITRFIAMTLFAAVTNSGNVLCWLLIYLEVHPAWKNRVRTEIQDFLETSSSIQSQPSVAPIANIIANMGTEAMEAQTPNLDLCINETLRMIFTGTFMRRNVAEDIFVSGTRIAHGTFLMYPTADLHFDPSIYPSPHSFRPDRWSPEAVEDRKKMGITFLGWGAGRHVCVGKRTALLMMKMIVVLVMAGFEADIVDERGQMLKELPAAKHDMLFKVCPTKDNVLLRYRRKPIGRD